VSRSLVVDAQVVTEPGSETYDALYSMRCWRGTSTPNS